MATATNENAIKLGGVTEIVLTPYKADGSGPDTNSYSLDNIVADTTAITQEESTTNTVECETRDEPIFENITLGRYTFTAESGDIQEVVLTNCFGFKKTTSGSLYAPSTYKEIWAQIEVKFGTNGSLVLPKVKMSGNIDASSLKTGMVRGVISGSAYSTPVKFGETAAVTTPFFYKAPAEGTVSIGEEAADVGA